MSYCALAANLISISTIIDLAAIIFSGLCFSGLTYTS
jgi:hypothetical protein